MSVSRSATTSLYYKYCREEDEINFLKTRVTLVLTAQRSRRLRPTVYCGDGSRLLQQIRVSKRMRSGQRLYTPAGCQAQQSLSINPHSLIRSK